MDIEKREIYRSIAELAYVIAMADKGLSAEERFAFTKIAEEELDFESWAAQSRFELLDEVIQPSIEKAYKDALHDLKKHKDHFTPEMKETAIRVMHKVAKACSGFSPKEAIIIDRFKKDLETL